MRTAIVAIASAVVVSAHSSGAAGEAVSGATRRMGGPCTYDEYEGTAVITRIEQTDESREQAKAGGGPGYEGFEVSFVFEPAGEVPEGLARQAIGKDHLFRLMNSWYPGARYIEKYGIMGGKAYKCTMKVIKTGTCSPILFKFEELNDTDYFESNS